MGGLGREKPIFFILPKNHLPQHPMERLDRRWEWRPWGAGGVAGGSMAVVGHPFDTLKTRAQTMPAAAPDAERTVGALTLTLTLKPAPNPAPNPAPKPNQVGAIWRQIVAEAGGVQRGVALLYRGLATCLLRAFPVNAVTFLVYKRSMAYSRAPSSERAA